MRRGSGYRLTAPSLWLLVFSVVCPAEKNSLPQGYLIKTNNYNKTLPKSLCSKGRSKGRDTTLTLETFF